MEKKMATTIVYWGNIGIMEKKMETTLSQLPCGGGVYCWNAFVEFKVLRCAVEGLGTHW